MATGKKRILRNAALALIVILCLLFFLRRPILRGVGGFLVVSDPLDRADAIAVLSGDGAVRGAKAAELYHQRWAPRILITKEGFPYREQAWRRYGVEVPETDTATVDVLRHLGVRNADMEVLEGYNESTIQEAGTYRHYAQGHGLKRLVVVTSNFHTRRSRMAFRKVFRGSNIVISVQAAPAEWSFNPDGWWTRRLDSKELLLEYQKLVYYWFRYW